jgi:hypothetical protein
MKHLAVIQAEFIKEATKWNDLPLEAQKEYLKRHPGSKRRITAKPKKPTEGVKELLKKKREQIGAGLTESSVFETIDDAITDYWDDDKVDQQTTKLKEQFPDKVQLIDEVVELAGNLSNDRSEAERRDKLDKFDKPYAKGISKIKKLLKSIYT